MRVKVKLVSMDTQLPPGFDEFGTGEVELDEAASVAGLLNKLALSSEETYMVLVNSETSPPSDRDTQTLADGDEVAVFPPMQGGS